MKQPLEADYISHVAYTRALEAYCDSLEQPPINEQEPVQKRPQNCGTGYCSCIECVMKPSPKAWLVEFENGDQELHFDEQSVGEIHTPLYTSPPQRKPNYKAFKDWAVGEGYDGAYAHDGIKWVCLSPMTADLWKCWQAAHSITVAHA